VQSDPRQRKSFYAGRRRLLFRLGADACAQRVNEIDHASRSGTGPIQGPLLRDTGLPDAVAPSASQHPVEDFLAEILIFLLGSRYCETDRLSDVAWNLFEKSPPGWARVQAICDFAHRHIAFGYEHARPTMTSWEVFNEGKGVCRDYAHLAITFCRCMNIPARYCTGYLGDIGVPPPYGPMDFAGWFEAYLGGRWYTFDARNNMPRIGRVRCG
jgi:transglutaminase-like putative cysteine protease